jgi:hypothetical protein
VDSDEQCLRRGDRFRQGDERPASKKFLAVYDCASPAPERRRDKAIADAIDLALFKIVRRGGDSE